jgi:hypothetical protein
MLGPHIKILIRAPTSVDDDPKKANKALWARGDKLARLLNKQVNMSTDARDIRDADPIMKRLNTSLAFLEMSMKPTYSYQEWR